ncbi:uncharacterized protein PAC_01648 [Phialocephala subalpina]|uniref:Uncharacterized protein n=1 Tax=Phialocephala subalpina TaxID=576137 RepID=A0A1L7WG81_9HELO|nr:uncharacterized protein PAC_01648 [Phialocephala subalpina]
MCRTTLITYDLCRHITTTTSSCLRTRANSIRSLFSSLSRPCTPSTTSKDVDDYCPRCSAFWGNYFVSDHSRRFRIKEFRTATGYTGPLTPIARASDNGEAWFFGFVMDDDPAAAPSPAQRRGNDNVIWENGVAFEIANSPQRTKPPVEDENAKFVNKIKGDKWEVDDYKAVLEMDKSRQKAPSISSTDTLWPGEEKKKRRGPEPDEFGSEEDEESDGENENRFGRPEAVDMRNLERGVIEVELRPAEPLPSVAPQRVRGEIGRSITRRNNWQETYTAAATRPKSAADVRIEDTIRPENAPAAPTPTSSPTLDVLIAEVVDSMSVW